MRDTSAPEAEDSNEIFEIVDHYEPPAPQSGQADYPAEALQEIQSLREQLKRRDAQIEQVMEAYRSKKDETEKLRRRIEKTERKRFEQSKGDFIARFVEVLDNLDRAIDSIENAFDPDSVLQGIMLVRSRLVQLLKEEGLEKIFVRGQGFDPSHSEAAEMQPVDEETQDGIVLRELQPGYMLKGSLLRVARVVVGRFGPDRPEQDKPPSTDPGQGAHTAPDPSWEAGETGHELEFGEEGLDFSSDEDPTSA
ncbi:MAG TPA: nucleotide exchange factor GrpE [Vicinamibacteria bacterium]|nr:nucleotide exchange factor GrpE [Vicinamibacteria bacterium]